MVKTGTRILGIAPYEGMRTVMERAAQAYPDVQLDVYIGDLLEGAAVVPVSYTHLFVILISL